MATLSQSQRTYPYFEKLRDVHPSTILFLLTIAIMVVVWFNPAYAASFLFEGLYDQEMNSDGAYTWTYPSLSVTAPLERVIPHVIIKQKLVAGPTYRDGRQLTVATKTSSIYTNSSHEAHFYIRGGDPRIYSYLFPTFGDNLVINYRIDPITNLSNRESRVLGFIIYETTIFYPGGIFVPSTNTIFALLIPILVFSATWAWFRSNCLSSLLSTVSTSILLWIYVHHRFDVLIASKSIITALITLTISGIIINILLKRYQETGVKLIIYSISAIIVPWIFMTTGANIGRHWRHYYPWGTILLLIPVLVSLLVIFIRHKKVVIILGVISIICSGLWGLNNFRQSLQRYGYDFSAYYEAALKFKEGKPIYDLEKAKTEYFSAYYKYPSFFLFFILPLTRFTFEESMLIFRLLNLILVILSIILICASNKQLNSKLIVLSILIILNFSPLYWSISLGQVDSILLFGISVAILSIQASKTRISAVVWGILGMIKIYPLFLLLVQMFERRFLYLVGVLVVIATLWTVSISYFGLNNEIDFWRMTIEAPQARTARLSNQSIYSVIARLYDPASAFSKDEIVVSNIGNFGHYIFSAFILAITMGILQKMRTQLSKVRWEIYSLLICCMLLLMPVSWDHYQTILILPLLIGLIYTMKFHYPPVTAALVLAYALIAFGSFKNIAVNIMPSSIVLFFASYRTFGLLILWAWWVYVLWNWKFCEETSSNA